MKVSVVIPVFNRAAVLASAIESIRQQDEQDFEIIIVDDGSADDPASVVNGFADPRIRLIRQENRGGGAARNAGIDAARAPLTAFLDSDDRFLPGHLRNRLRLLARSGVDCVYGSILADRGNGITLVKPPRQRREGEPMGEYLFCDRGWMQTSSLCLRTALARKVRFNEAIRYGQDCDFVLRLDATGARFAFSPEATVHYADHEDPGRLSVARNVEALEAWLAAATPLLGQRATTAFRGWHLARPLARTRYFTALGLCLKAIFLGVWSSRLALTVLLQVALPDSAYRRLADRTLQRKTLSVD